MESDGFGFHFPIFDVNFISAEYNRDVFAHTNQVPVPVGYVFVSNSCRYIKHDDSALTWRVHISSWRPNLLNKNRETRSLDQRWPNLECSNHLWDLRTSPGQLCPRRWTKVHRGLWRISKGELLRRELLWEIQENVSREYIEFKLHF